ncbi:MAG: tetratricopeptide repeat protein [Rhodobacteraceae bacterium]|nr:tetratricopeptide repeat protein [Paracoccaceae bacterium]
MYLRKTLILLTSLAFISLVSACDSAEERAEKHYQQGLELLQEGDVDRALVEFRNVFELNGKHHDARLAYARAVQAQGKYQEAYSQFLRFVEFYPEELDGRRELAEMALQAQNWDEAERHIKVAAEIAPDDPRVRVVLNTLAYKNALQSNDKEAQRKAVADAMVLKEELPDSIFPRRIIIDGLLQAGDERGALKELDEALATNKTDLNLYRIRLTLLNQLGESDAVEAQLIEMIKIFPDNLEARQTLVRWYLSRKELDKAERFLRQLAATGGDAGKADLIRFLMSTKGIPAAKEELDRIIASGDNPDFYRSLRAGLNFDEGKPDEAIAELENVLASAEPSDQTRNIKVALARIRWATGNLVGARELIEQVLTEDATQLEALKLKAGWLIDADQTDEAIILLRQALDQSPQDAQIMTLMARAYERDGSRDLMGEMLSLAVEASNSAPAESMLYARFLMSDQKDLPAEGILVNALRLAPNNLQILGMLGDVYLRLKDWPRATQIVDTLDGLEGPQAESMAKNLKLALLQAQEHGDEVMRFLEDLEKDGDNKLQVQVAIIRTHIANNRLDEAMKATDEALAEFPDNPGLRAIRGRLLESTGQPDQAIAIYRQLLAENDQREALWRELYAVLRRAGKPAEADQALADGLAAIPNAATLKWIKASLLEQANDIDGAIAIYEELYAQDSNSLIIANNLASLLANNRTDAESLERAYVIARRLRATKQPAFQDTYGWIAYRRGDYDEALSHLEPAANAGLKDASVHYHLGMVYAALTRPDEANKQFQIALDLTGDNPDLPLNKQIHAAMDKLKAPPSSD